MKITNVCHTYHNIFLKFHYNVTSISVNTKNEKGAKYTIKYKPILRCHCGTDLSEATNPRFGVDIDDGSDISVVVASFCLLFVNRGPLVL